MAQCVEIVAGQVVQSASNVASCPGYVLLDPVDYQSWLAQTQEPFDPVFAGQIWVLFFTLTLAPWAIVKGVSFVAEALKRA